MRSFLVITGLSLAMIAGQAQAGVVYANSSAIDLIRLHGNDITSSQDLAGTNVVTRRAAHPSYNADTRIGFASGVTTEGVFTGTSAWWAVEFAGGESYWVQDYFFYTHTIHTSITYRVETYDTVLDAWVPQTIGLAGADADGWITTNNNPPVLSGSFINAVNTTAVRLNVGSATGWNTFIIAAARVTGPNDNVAVNPAISLAQPAWNGNALPTYTDKNNVNPVTAAYLTDNYTPERMAAGQSWGIQVYPDKDNGIAAQLTVPLADLYAVNAVALTTSVTDARRPEHVEIWYSPDAAGNVWLLATTATFASNTTDPYYYIDLGKTVEAQRIRFDLLDSHNNNSILIAQLYVYGNAVPEPATMSLLALGGLALLRRRKA
ncbi:MAG: PEP-CTERM sorting domain-containing protein [Phycisphaerae bacterium]|nr:PEP-CTERM sorting domain-containing protein [Phycisphaerae bacterium]